MTEGVEKVGMAYERLHALECVLLHLEPVANEGEEFVQASDKTKQLLAEIILSDETPEILTLEKEGGHLPVFAQAIGEITQDVFGCPFADSRPAEESIAWLGEAITAACSMGVEVEV